MRYWSTAGGIEADVATAADVIHVVQLLRTAFDDMDAPKPELVAIGRSDNQQDGIRYEVLITLGPAVQLQADWGNTELVPEGFEAEDDEVRFVEQIIDNVRELRQRFETAQLESILHDARVRVRRVLAGWAKDGSPSRLEDIWLAPLDRWSDALVPSFNALIEGLDRGLRPVIRELQLGDAASIELTLASELTEHAYRIERRTALWREGADGSIDKIAINAIAQFGDVAATIRRFSREDRLWLPDGTCVSVMDGHISISNWAPDADWIWHDDGFTLFDRKPVPDTVLAAAAGRPSISLFEHPYLSADVIIAEATAGIDDHGAWMLLVMVTQPKRLFCSVTGRVWSCTTDTAPSVFAIDEVPKKLI